MVLAIRARDKVWGRAELWELLRFLIQTKKKEIDQRQIFMAELILRYLLDVDQMHLYLIFVEISLLPIYHIRNAKNCH